MDIRGDEARKIIGRYPNPRSALMPLLWLAQGVDGWITPQTKQEIAELTGATLTEVQEVVSFYSQFQDKPVGKFVLGVCATLPCALCGAEGLVEYLEETLGVKVGETTPDGLFTIEEMECLGACSEAPVMLVNQKLHARLTREKIDTLLEECRSEVQG